MINFDPFTQWPADRPRPTSEEMKAAEDRMHEENKEWYAKGYMGDFGFTLPFTMTTYNRLLWWHFFFPDERAECQRQMSEQLSKICNDAGVLPDSPGTEG